MWSASPEYDHLATDFTFGIHDGGMTEAMKIPLGSYEELLFVQARRAIYYSMLERSLLLSYGQHDIEWSQQFMAH